MLLHKFTAKLSKGYKKVFSDSELKEFLLDPYPKYELLRKIAPVFWSEHFKHWLVLDYEKVYIALTDKERFSSESLETFSLLSANRELLDPFLEIMGRWLVLKDDPKHKAMRNVLAKVFTPKFLNSKKESFRQISDELIKEIEQGDDIFDFHSQLSVPFASRVFMNLFGIPFQDVNYIEPLIKDLALVVGRTRDANLMKRGIRGIKEMEKYLLNAIENKKQQPGNDIITLLINANKKGILDDKEMVAQAIMLLSGGFETISATLSGGMLALLKNPKELLKLKNDPSIIPLAIEECLRFVAPAQSPTRIARYDMDFFGVKIKKGEGVAPVVASANRDPKVFDRPNQLIVDRTPNEHLAMGKGSHHCIGAILSRMELQIFFEQFLTSDLVNMSLVDDKYEDWNTDNFSFRIPKSILINKSKV